MHINLNRAQNICINGTPLENITDFKYLGSVKTNDGSCSKDIKIRIAMAKHKMVELNNLWKDRGIPNELKVKLLKCLIWPVMIYGCEAWTLKKADINKIDAAEMWLYRRLLRVSWKAKRTNASILEELNASKQLSTYVSKRKLKYVGHVVRNTRTTLMASVLQGKIEGPRKKGRPPISYAENILRVSGLSVAGVARECQDREGWRRVVNSLGAAANIDPDDADR